MEMGTRKRERGRCETNETNDSARARIIVERPREREKEEEKKRAHGKDDEWGLWLPGFSGARQGSFYICTSEGSSAGILR
jgi:hypothetical protein